MTAAKQDANVALDFEVMPIDGPIGAEIRGLDLRRLNDATFKRLHALWLHHLLLLIRGQTITPDDLVTLIKHFGTPVTSSTLHQRDLKERKANQLFNLPPEVTVVTNLKENGEPVGILGDGELAWHLDFSFKERPTAARMLVAIEVPPLEKGGNTMFLNACAAYDALPDELKRRIAGKTIKQGNIVDTAMKLRPGATLEADIRTTPGPSHPIIATHALTGANILFLGRRHAAYVNGLSLEDSEALLDELWAHCTQRQFIYEHRWQKGDVVVWDNHATLHRRDAFDSLQRRVLYAAQVEGPRPVEAPDALTRPAHGRAKLAA